MNENLQKARERQHQRGLISITKHCDLNNEWDLKQGGTTQIRDVNTKKKGERSRLPLQLVQCGQTLRDQRREARELCLRGNPVKMGSQFVLLTLSTRKAMVTWGQA